MFEVVVAAGCGVGAALLPPCIGVGWAPPDCDWGGTSAGVTVMTDAAGISTVFKLDAGWLGAARNVVFANACGFELRTTTGGVMNWL
jgi:hypothetical protein